MSRIFLFLAAAILAVSADDATTNSSAASTNVPPGVHVVSGDDVGSGPAASSTPTLSVSNDAGMGSDGTAKDQQSYQVRIGELYAPAGECYIMPVRLPSLVAGQKLATVHLRFQLLAVNNEANGLANADLYSLGVRADNKALAGDYFQGTKDPKATLVQAGFLTPASKVRTDANNGPYVETSPDADATLARILNDALAKPENAGKYLFLRISYDADPIPTGNNAYMLLTTGATGDTEPPLVTYTLKQ